MKQQNVFIATLILTSASLITKLMGFFYRVFMSNTIGAEGMGLYQLIMPIYSLAWSITSAGFTTTISHLTAQENVKGNSKNISRILKHSLLYSAIISIFISLFLYIGGEFIGTNILKEPRTSLSFKFLAFAVPFMTAGSCLRGYFLGMQYPIVPAVSQVLEQIIRIGTVCFLTGYFLPYGLEVACAVTIIGIVLGEFISFLYVVFRYKLYKNKHSKSKNKLANLNNSTLSHLSVSKLIFTMAIPLCGTRVVGSLLVTIENMLIPRQLQLYGQDVSTALENYGELTGMAMPLVFLPSAFLMAVSISLVPELAKACAVNNKEKIQRTVSATFLFTFVLGIGTASLFAVFPREICYIVYSNQNLGELLFPLAFICPFLYAQITMQGLLNGLGEQTFLFFNHIISSIITISGIFFLMPEYGISGFLISMWASLAVSMGVCLLKLYVKTKIFPSINNCFVRPLLAGVASALIVRYSIQISSPSKVLFLCSISSMGLLYLFFLYLQGCFSQSELGIMFKKIKK